MNPSPLVLALAPGDPASFAPLEAVARLQLPVEARLLTEEEILGANASDGPVAGLICPGEFAIREDLLDGLPHLRVIANTAAGFNNLPLEVLAARGIWATNTPDAFVDATADATLALLLAVARKIAEADAYVRTGEWVHDGPGPDRWAGMQLRGKTLGIVGYGRIGRAVAQRAQAFGMRVLHARRQPDGEEGHCELDPLLAQADVVSLHVPLTGETRHLLNRETLWKMKPGSLLLNMARGPVVEEAALVEALKDGHLAGAGLDVFEEEPAVSPDLLLMPQVVLTPTSGVPPRESRSAARITASENVAAVLRGEEPPNALNRPESPGADDLRAPGS